MCREAAGVDESDLELHEAATVDSFWIEAIKKFPALEKYKSHSRIAVNMEYAAQTRLLRENDEVCIIPPVSGG